MHMHPLRSLHVPYNNQAAARCGANTWCLVEPLQGISSSERHLRGETATLLNFLSGEVRTMLVRYRESVEGFGFLSIPEDSFKPGGDGAIEALLA